MTPETNELDALIAEQERDEQWGHRVDVRGVSLDFTFEGGGSFGDIVGYSSGAGDIAIRRIPRPQAWARRDIITAIRSWVKEHGELPRYADWNHPAGRGIPSAASVARKFGTWSDGMRAAGFEPRPVGGPRSPVQGTRLRRRIDTRHSDAFLTTEQIAAAYVLYDRRRLSITQIADQLWQRYGYSSPQVCRTALQRAFHAEGFRLRTKSEARMCLTPEHRAAIAAKARAARTTFEKGEQKPNAKLTEADVRAIRASADTTASLARRYNVSQTTIRFVRTRRTWRHVTDEVVA